MIIHTVKKGDTLYEIGKKYGVTIEQLVNANGASVMPTLIVGQAVIVPTPSEKFGDILVNGYAYTGIENGVLNNTLPYLSMITPFSHGVNPDGTLVPLDDAQIVATALSMGVKPLLLVTTLAADGRFSSRNAATILADPVLTETLVDNIIAKLQEKDYYGVDVDFEYIPSEYGNAYADFIELLHTKANPLGYKVLVAVAPKTSREQRGLLYEAHIYDRLGAVADYVLVMTYEWGYTYGPPMAVAPLDKVAQVLRYAVSEIPPEKVLMGIPNYGYDWTLPFVRGQMAQSITNDRAIEIARTYGAEIEFDNRAMTPFFNYYDRNGKQHVVWFEDARSIAAKLALLRDLNLAGASIWNVMSFFKPMYTVMQNMFNITKL